MSELIDTTEMYLRTVYELNEEGIPPMRARMERDGLLVLQPNRQIQLTDEGQALAEAVMRKHRLAERLLTDVIGLDWELVHAEACRWEHVISEEVERKLYTLLQDPSHSPYGNPIPGLGAFGSTADTECFREGNVPVIDLASSDGPVRVRLERMSEMVQADDDVLALLAGAGVRPGVVLAVQVGDQVEVCVEGGTPVPVPDWVADGLFGRIVR